MDPATASYYRAIIFLDPGAQEKLPESLIKIHTWAIKRNQFMGLGGVISKQTALAVSMLWMAMTKEGREYAKSSGLGDIMLPTEEDKAVNWDFVAKDTPVTVIHKGNQVIGKYIGQRSGGFIEISIDDETKAYRPNQVKLFGV